MLPCLPRPALPVQAWAPWSWRSPPACPQSWRAGCCTAPASVSPCTLRPHILQVQGGMGGMGRGWEGDPPCHSAWLLHAHSKGAAGSTSRPSLGNGASRCRVQTCSPCVCMRVETSPARVRGLLISLKEAFIVGGILAGWAGWLAGCAYYIPGRVGCLCVHVACSITADGPPAQKNCKQSAVRELQANTPWVWP